MATRKTRRQHDRDDTDKARLACWKRIVWREGDPDATREEWAVLRLLANSIGKGRLHAPSGSSLQNDCDLSTIADFASRFLEDATTSEAWRAWSRTLGRLFRAQVLERYWEPTAGEPGEYHGVGPRGAYRYVIALDTDYARWWAHPETLRDDLVRAGVLTSEP